MIPDEAVEAAARIYEPNLWDYFDQIGAGSVGSPVELARNKSLGLARRVLTAAAPFIAAQAWDEGKQAGHDHMIGKQSTNPYRSGT